MFQTTEQQTLQDTTQDQPWRVSAFPFSPHSSQNSANISLYTAGVPFSSKPELLFFFFLPFRHDILGHFGDRGSEL